MLTISDPCELKAADIYRQARTVASKTSRGTDGNWYRGPEELPCQWHIWFDGGREVCSAIYSRLDKKWQKGPELPLANLTTAEGVSEMLGEFLSTTHFPEPPKAIGVILHIADEFSLAEISQSADTAEGADDLGLLRYNLIDEPKEVLADREVSVEANSWRLLPFWGAAPGQPRFTAVALSRSREAFLQELLACGEEMRLPVRVAVTSAPVEALAAMPLLQPAMSGGCLIALQYLKYTTVCALSTEGELRSVRTLAHRGGLLVPTGFGDILWNMAIGAELAGPEAAAAGQPKVYLVSADQRALQSAQQDLEVYSLSRQKIHWEVVDLTTHPALTDVPGNRLEFLMYDPHVVEQVRSGATPLAATETFRSLWSGWASQSYFDTGKLDNRYPSLRDLRLLRFASWLVYFLTFALVSSAAYGTYSLFSAMNHPSWQLTPEQVDLTKARHAKLMGERKQIDVTKRLLLPRSRGWVTLEFLMQLFPEDSGVRLESFDYSLEAARAAPSKAKAAASEYTGLSRVWTVKGLVKPKGMELLSNLNSQRGLKAFFERMAKATEDPAYEIDPERQLTVTLTQGRNTRFDPQAEAADLARDPSLSYPFNFEATITQTLSAKDPLALPVQKPF